MAHNSSVGPSAGQNTNADTGVLVIIGALIFWGVSVFDFFAVQAAWPPYAEAYGDDLFAWLQGFPLVRKLVWAAGVACGTAGALAMIWRPARAGDLMLGGVGLMVLGLAWDLVFAQGVTHYGSDGLFSSAVVVAIASALAWAAYRRGKAAA